VTAFKSILARLKRMPWSLGIALGMILFITPHPEWHGDFQVFRQSAETLRHPYYARWLFGLLGVLPEWAAYLLFESACTALLYFAVRVWKGRHWMMFLSFPFAWTLFYGQIDGIVVGGLALAGWALEREDYLLLGAGLTLASIKPQVGLPLGLAMWWWSNNRWKPLLIPVLVLGVSFLQWGFWIPAWFAALFSTSDLVSLSRNLSLWTLAGPWILLVWIPIAFLPVPRPRKLAAIAAGTMLSMPYFPLSSAVLFLGMSVPWPFFAAVQLPAFTSLFGSYEVYDWLRLLPPALLVWAAWPVFKRLKQPERITHEEEQKSAAEGTSLKS
jgi:hypothetical protein